MNALVIVCLVACIAAAVYARYRSNLEAAAAPAKPAGYRPVKRSPEACWPCADKYGYDFAAYHLFHGPNSDCPDCEDK